MSHLDSPIIKTLRFLWFTPGNKEVWGLPALYRAQPGTSKTSIGRFAAKVFGMPCKTLSPGLHGEGAFGVVMTPMKHGDRTYLDAPPPFWVRAFRDAADQPIPSVLICDEVLTAPPGLRAPMLAMIDERTVGECFLGAPCRVIGFTNDADESGGDDLLPPMANRFMHPLWHAPNVEQWSSFVMAGENLSDVKAELDPIAEQNRVLKLWPSAYATASALVTSYLRANPSDLHRQPKIGDPGASKAWASRRSWELAVRVLAGAKIHGIDEAETFSYVEATVGEAVSSKFVEYLKKMDLPTPEDVLDGKVQILPIDPTRLDKTYVVLESCAAFLTNTKTKKVKAREETMWDILGKIAAVTPDVILRPSTVLAKANIIPTMQALPVLAKNKDLALLFSKYSAGSKP